MTRPAWQRCTPSPQNPCTLSPAARCAPILAPFPRPHCAMKRGVCKVLMPPSDLPVCLILLAFAFALALALQCTGQLPSVPVRFFRRVLITDLLTLARAGAFVRGYPVYTWHMEDALSLVIGPRQGTQHAWPHPPASVAGRMKLLGRPR